MIFPNDQQWLAIKWLLNWLLSHETRRVSVPGILGSWDSFTSPSEMSDEDNCWTCLVKLGETRVERCRDGNGHGHGDGDGSTKTMGIWPRKSWGASPPKMGWILHHLNRDFTSKDGIWPSKMLNSPSLKWWFGVKSPSRMMFFLSSKTCDLIIDNSWPSNMGRNNS